MSVLVRSKRGESSGRKRRLRPAGRRDERVAATAPTDASAGNDRALSAKPPAPGRRRELGPVQDQALYTCECGFVFKATVSTSVGCPHCGGTQAW